MLNWSCIKGHFINAETKVRKSFNSGLIIILGSKTPEWPMMDVTVNKPLKDHFEKNLRKINTK